MTGIPPRVGRRVTAHLDEGGGSATGVVTAVTDEGVVMRVGGRWTITVPPDPLFTEPLPPVRGGW